MTKRHPLLPALVLAVALGASTSCTGSSNPSSATTTASVTGTSGSSGSPATSSSAGTTSPTTASPASGLCANRFQPVSDGDTWTYEMSGSSGTSSYTDTITAVAISSFTVTSEFEHLTKDTKWACAPNGLVALQYGGGASGTLASADLSASFTTTRVKGVTLPTSLGPGSSWEQTYGLKGVIDVGGTRAKAEGDVVEEFDAKNVASVTVPAGTFDAIAIDTMITLELRTSVGGVETPVNLTFEGTTYLAEGIGMVKSTSDTTLLGQAIDSTIELTDYRVS